MAPPPDSRKSDTLTLPDGRVLEPGTEFSIKGQGRYLFKYGWKGTEATAYGPVASQDAMWRTFRASAITRIHKPKLTKERLS